MFHDYSYEFLHILNFPDMLNFPGTSRSYFGFFFFKKFQIEWDLESVKERHGTYIHSVSCHNSRRTRVLETLPLSLSATDSVGVLSCKRHNSRRNRGRLLSPVRPGISRRSVLTCRIGASRVAATIRRASLLHVAIE